MRFLNDRGDVLVLDYRLLQHSIDCLGFISFLQEGALSFDVAILSFDGWGRSVNGLRSLNRWRQLLLRSRVLFLIDLFVHFLDVLDASFDIVIVLNLLWLISYSVQILIVIDYRI